MTINESGLIPIKKNGVIVYIGDTEKFQNDLSKMIKATDSEIDQAIMNATEGIIVEKGSGAFQGDFDYIVEVGTKVSFKGFHGQLYTRKAGTYKIMNNEFKNFAYYRILEDHEIKAICTN